MSDVRGTIRELRECLVPERIVDPALMRATQVEATLVVAEAIDNLVHEMIELRLMMRQRL